MNDTAQTIADAVGQGMYAKDKAAQALGITLLDVGPGYGRACRWRCATTCSTAMRRAMAG